MTRGVILRAEPEGSPSRENTMGFIWVEKYLKLLPIIVKWKQWKI